VLGMRSRRALAAENLFLRKQLALFQERKLRPRRADDSTRLVMVILGRMFSWRDAPADVKPETPIRWPPGVSPPRALEITAARPASPAQRPAPTHPGDGRGESDLGRGAHCQRVEAQTAHSGLPTHRRQVPFVETVQCARRTQSSAG